MLSPCRPRHRSQWRYNAIDLLAFEVGGDAFNPLMSAALRFGNAAILVLPIAA